MKVTVRMSGLIARQIPGSAEGVAMTLLDGATVSSLMTRLGLPGNDSYLVLVNEATVPKDRRTKHRLADGDRIAIVPPLRGG